MATTLPLNFADEESKTLYEGFEAKVWTLLEVVESEEVSLELEETAEALQEFLDEHAKEEEEEA
jgi:hypothetical protein